MKSNPVRILAIESSCDDTSVAIVEEGPQIVSNRVSSQIEIHQQFGGVVPEVASRKHVESITWMIEEALNMSNLSLQDVSAIAVTRGPGLVGSLLVGVIAAKSLALAEGLPLIGVHHIAGHIYANQFVKPMAFPLIALVVSGGHTELVYMESHGKFKIIGQTRDDAAGEAFDKVARAMNLPYPGGPHIDRLAAEAKDAINMPRAWLHTNSYDFSFSGLKSAVLNVINQAKMKNQEVNYRRLARGFQESVIDVLVEKSIKAAKAYQVKQLVVAGGVAANQGLRTELIARCDQEGISLSIPPLNLCTDNAAMIAAAAFVKWEQQKFDGLEMKTFPMLSLEDW